MLYSHDPHSATEERPRAELPTNVIPRHYDLTLRPDLTTFVSRGQVAITLDVAADSTSITLNALNIKVNSATLVVANDGAVVDAEGDPVYNSDEQTVTLLFPTESPALRAGSKGVKLLIDFTGEINAGMMGFYRCKYSEEGSAEGQGGDGAKYAAATQFEATFARAALPCFDEPKYKTTFDVTIVVDKHLTALSNGDVVSQDVDSVNEGKKIVKFERTPVMSTYLLAWAIGEFEYIEAYTRPTPALPDPVRCRVYTTKGLVHRGQFALALATNLLELFSDMFAMPYPLRKCDQVCVHEFACFAMENWALITYRDIALLLDTAAAPVPGSGGGHGDLVQGKELASEQAKMMVATTVAHEFSHQWFGNLVTFTQFDDLWLNEGFATWVGTYGTALMYPQWDVWTQFVSDDFSFALRTDGYRSSHPVQIQVVDPKEIEEIFDDVSYSKGSSVIRMLAEWLGPETFLTGIRAYLRRYAYKNTTTEDLYRILSETSGQDVSSVMGIWTRKVGYPVLTLSESGRLTQRRFLHTGRIDEHDDDTIWPLPLNIALVPEVPAFTDAPRRSSATIVSRELMVDKHLDLHILKSTPSASPPLIVINSDRIGLYRVAYPPAHLRSLAHAAAQGRLSIRDRLGLVDDAFNLARAGDIPTSEYLALLDIMIPNELDLVVVKEAARGIGALTQVVRTATAASQVNQDLMCAFRGYLFGSQAERLGFEPVYGEDALVRLLRPLVVEQVGLAGGQRVICEAQRRFGLFLAGGNSAIAPDMYKVVFSLVVAHGGEQAWQQVFDLYQSSSLADVKFGALYALGQATDEALVMRTLALAINTEVVRQQDIDHVFTSVSDNPTHRALLWSFLKSNWSLIFARYDAQAGILAQCISNATAFAITDRDLADIKAFFAEKDTSSFVRTLNEVCERALAMSLWVERQGKEAVSWMRQWNGVVEKESKVLNDPSVVVPLSV